MKKLMIVSLLGIATLLIIGTTTAFADVNERYPVSPRIYLPVSPYQFEGGEFTTVRMRSYYADTNVVAVEFQNWSNLYRFIIVEVQAVTSFAEDLDDPQSKPRIVILSNVDPDQPEYNKKGILPLNSRTYYIDFNDQMRTRENAEGTEELEMVEYYSLRWAAHDRSFERAWFIANEVGMDLGDLMELYNDYMGVIPRHAPAEERINPSYPTFDEYLVDYIRAQEEAEEESQPELSGTAASEMTDTPTN
jgi:hypothetical protein